MMPDPKRFVRYAVIVVLSFTLLQCGTQEETIESEKQQPNIIMFLVDDMGWQDTSVPFHTSETQQNRTFRTPNMERLAAEGMKFTQAYSSSVCSPTRVSLMTGINAARHRVTNWTLRYNSSNDAKDEQLEFPKWNVNGMTPIDTVVYAVYAKPLPQLLKENGYFTVHAGKAHLGAISTPASDPLNLGFDKNIAGHAAGAPASYLGSEAFGNNNPKRSVWAVPGLEAYHEKDIFLSEALTLEAVKALKANEASGKPFFLYMSHYAVHTPIMADDRYFNDYLALGLDTIEARYASMVQGMDKSLGDLMDYLKETDQSDNTVILFMSDNGGLSAHARGGEPHVHNAPLNSGKGSAYEGGIREPMLVKWSGVTQPGSSTDGRVIIEDFFTTILDVAGVEYEVPQVVDGVTFVPQLKGEAFDNDRPMFWHYPNKWGGVGPGIGPSSTIRKGDWKLIYFHKSRHFELYNIPKDIGEINNLVDSNPKVLQSLATELGTYLKEVGAQMPYDKLADEPVPYPDELF